jgi:hypothetical protein
LIGSKRGTGLQTKQFIESIFLISEANNAACRKLSWVLIGFSLESSVIQSDQNRIKNSSNHAGELIPIKWRIAQTTLQSQNERSRSPRSLPLSE